VDLNTATISSLGPNINSSSVTNAGNGWYRYSVTFTPTSAHTMTNVMYVGAYGSTVTQHYAQVYGFQIQYGSAAPFVAAFLYNGSTQYMTTTIPDSFWNAGSWTVSTWVNFARVNSGVDSCIIGHGSGTNNNGLHLVERNGYILFGMYANDLNTSVTPININTWYNIVFAFDYSTKVKTMYVNGILNGQGGTVGYTGTGSNTQIGQCPWSTSAKVFGTIASVSFYNSPLTATEISLNYNSTKGRFLN
jgi:hypothetical protein